MIHDTDIPDGWTKIAAEFDQQQQVFQRRRDGLVLSIERGTCHNSAFAAYTLPENFVDDNQIIDAIERGDRATVEREATQFMEENER